MNHSHCSEYIVTPLVGAWYQGGDKAVDNQDQGREDGHQDVGQIYAGREQKLNEEQWQCNEPLDVPYILDKKCVSFS